MNNDLPYFWGAFGLYAGATVSYGGFLAARKQMFARVAVFLLALGFAVLSVGQLIRWKMDGHFPISNMHEYLRCLAWSISIVYLGLLVIKMKQSYVGAFVAPLAFLIMVLASIFPMQFTPQLVPALQSYWIKIHVPTIVFGTGAFATSFAAGLLYLLRTYVPQKTPVAVRNQLATQAVIATVFGLAVGTLIILATHYAGPTFFFKVMAILGVASLFGVPAFWILVWLRVGKTEAHAGLAGEIFAGTVMAFLLGSTVTAIMRAVPSWNYLQAPQGQQALVFLPYIGSMVVIGLVLLPLVNRMSNYVRPFLPSEDMLDEVGYRAASIGYPVWGIGTAFGAMWAYDAWGRAWGFDPKEVGALIVFLVMSGYMHARLARDWRGRGTAVLAVLGFLCALFTLFGNTFLGGLHAYA